MATNVLILGASGSGKSTSIRNLPSDKTFIFQVINKILPFKGAFVKFPLYDPKTNLGNRKVVLTQQVLDSEDKTVYADTCSKLATSILAVEKLKPEVKYIVIDDSQYLMAYEYMARAKERGYDRFTEIQQNFFKVITAGQKLKEDKFVFYLHHIDENGQGKIKAKTIGQMIDNTISLEGLFSIVLVALPLRENGKTTYQFQTQTDGLTPAKSPEGMFDSQFIPNDLAYVIDKITQYYNN